ncbi:hypothetical protein [Streptomyces sp. NPDC096142]|uniref:hypothetical protein n=1 Tax=Streptomyces sp. NPDC096142 TaxID=3366077 RepID=UPI00380A735D
MLRLRFRVLYCPRRALALIDTPAPDCPTCQGTGGIAHDYGHPETGEYEGTDWEFCPCSTTWALTLLPLPRLPRFLRRRKQYVDPWGPDGYSSEPPF